MFGRQAALRTVCSLGAAVDGVACVKWVRGDGHEERAELPFADRVSGREAREAGDGVGGRGGWRDGLMAGRVKESSRRDRRSRRIKRTRGQARKKSSGDTPGQERRREGIL